MDIRTSSKLSHSDNISTGNTCTRRKKTFHYFSLQTSQERNQNARWINALGNIQPKQNAFRECLLFLCKPIFLKQKRKLVAPLFIVYCQQQRCGARLVGYLQKDLLHMLSLINIEIYKTKQNDANINNIINLKLKLLIHQICSSSFFVC